jgi:hypothetical protein
MAAGVNRPKQSGKSFDFLFDSSTAPLLRLVGISPETSRVVVDDEWLVARFGRWRLRTPLVNVVGASITGPYRPWRAIGIRLSMEDRGLTFGSSARQGVHVVFREPVGRLRHPNLTVTVADVEGLAQVLAAGAAR